jgi:hypothetical protein
MIDEYGTKLECGYKYDSEIIDTVNNYNCFQKPNLIEAIVPAPDTFSFHKHFDCDYLVSNLLFISKATLPWSIQLNGSNKIYSASLNLQNFFNYLPPGIGFYIDIAYFTRRWAPVMVFTSSTRKYNQFQLSYFNSPINYTHIRQDNANYIDKIFIFADTLSFEAIEYIIIALEA